MSNIPSYLSICRQRLLSNQSSLGIVAISFSFWKQFLLIS